MLDTRTLLSEPTPRAARAIGLRLLDDLDAQHRRLGRRRDKEALHDFRVALRRLRSWLRAYRRAVRDSVTRKTLRRLGDLTRATTQSRDIEVHLEWLTAQRASMRAPNLPGLRWVIQLLTQERRRADAAFREAIRSDFSALSGRLRKNLSRYAVAVQDPSGGDRWASTAAVQVHDAFQDFRNRIGLIADVRDDEHLHRTRIAGKRLRYLIEPLTEMSAEVPAALESLKRVQDLLGSVHDAHVFGRVLRRYARALPATRARGRADARPAFRALAARLGGRRRAAWKAYSTAWMTADFPVLTRQVHAIVEALREAAGAGVEIERKYLLRRLPPEAKAAQSMVIDQGYLPGSTLIERLRRVETADGAHHDRTVKSGAGLVRTELTEPCTPELFAVLWPLTEGKRLRKRRYRLVDTGHVWEIDEFLDRRLMLAEIELTSAREEVAIPGWLAPCVVREVTDDAEYLNYTLAR